MNGFILLHRKMVDWEWFDDSDTLKTFIYLLLKANWEDKKWQGITVHRGELITSMKNLSENLHFTLRHTSTLLSHLKTTNEISIKATNKYTIITICNYDTYQDLSGIDEEQIVKQNVKQNVNPTANESKTKVKQPSTTKQYNNNNNKETKEQDIYSAPAQKFSFRDALIGMGIDSELIAEFMKIREKKRAVNSEFAMKVLLTEAGKAGVTLDEAIRVCCENQWRGFKAEWYFNLSQRTSPATSEPKDIARILDCAEAMHKYDQSLR